MTYSEALFLRTLDDCSSAIAGEDEYELLRSTGLLRQLLIDGRPLVDVVNQKYHKKITFRIYDTWDTPHWKLEQSLGVIEKFILDGLCPSRALLNAPEKYLSKDQFLKHPVIYHQSKYYTVLDIIKTTAHVLGGVHLGEAHSDKEKFIRELNTGVVVGGMSVPFRQLIPILDVVLEALKPLEDLVRESLCDGESR